MMKEKNNEHEIDIDPELLKQALDSVEPKEPEKKPEEDLQQQFLRLAADFDNFRKRTQKEKSELVRYGNETMLRDILPILDNFERAVEHAKKANDVDSIRQGVEMILSQLNSTLIRFGLTSKPAKGSDFDPMVHEAVSHINSDTHEPNTVIEEHQKAYYLHDRLIRPALVTVSKGSDEGEK